MPPGLLLDARVFQPHDVDSRRRRDEGTPRLHDVRPGVQNRVQPEEARGESAQPPRFLLRGLQEEFHDGAECQASPRQVPRSHTVQVLHEEIHPAGEYADARAQDASTRHRRRHGPLDVARRRRRRRLPLRMPKVREVVQPQVQPEHARAGLRDDERRGVGGEDGRRRRSDPFRIRVLARDEVEHGRERILQDEPLALRIHHERGPLAPPAQDVEGDDPGVRGLLRRAGSRDHGERPRRRLLGGRDHPLLLGLPHQLRRQGARAFLVQSVTGGDRARGPEFQSLPPRRPVHRLGKTGGRRERG